jgi:hypothetical protein
VSHDATGAGSATAADQSNAGPQSPAAEGFTANKSAGTATVAPAARSLAQSTTQADAVAPSTFADAQRCALAIQRSQHPGRFSLWGSATYRREPALIVEFQSTTKPPVRHRAFVVNPSTCAVLTFAAY